MLVTKQSQDVFNNCKSKRYLAHVGVVEHQNPEMNNKCSQSSIESQFQFALCSGDLRWVDEISRAGHPTGEHEGGDSLQLPKIVIISFS